MAELGYQIIAISPDLPERTKQLMEEKKYSYVLLSDSKKIAAKAYGIAFTLSDPLNTMYKEKGISIEDASGEADHVLPVPAVYIIGTDGIIQFQYVNPDYAVRIDIDVLVSAAIAVQRPKK